MFTARYGLNSYMQFRLILVSRQAVPWLKLLVAGFSPHRDLGYVRPYDGKSGTREVFP